MSFFSNLYSRVRRDEFSRCASLRIPPERVLDAGTDAETDTFVVQATYFELRLSQMFLRDGREYLRGFVPLVSMLTRFHFDGERRVLPAVIGPAALQGAEHVAEDDPVEILNRRVAGPFPYTGDDVELFAGLFRVEVANWAKQALSFAETIAKAVDVTKLSSYLDVAGSLNTALSDLLGMRELEFRVGIDRTYLGVGSPSPDKTAANLLQPGYDVILSVDDRHVSHETRRRLWVKDARLHIGDDPGHLSPYTEHDFLLLRIAALTRRDDYTSFGFHRNHWTRLQEHVWAERDEAAQTELRLLGAELAQTPDITRQHRSALIIQYKHWYEDEKAQVASLLEASRDRSGFDDLTAGAGPRPVTEHDIAGAVGRADLSAETDPAFLLARL